MTARSRNAQETRAELLAAARARFAADGFERTTLRAVAADVGIDPALVIRYFGNKQELFAAAAEFTLDLPDLSDVEPDELAEALLPRFLAVWEDDGQFLALLRAAMTSPAAADKMREVFAEQGFGAPVAEIAQRAGVGVASIYRRWPSKTELAEQVRISCLSRIVAEARAAVAEEADPWRAFTRFLFRCLGEGSGVGTVLPPDGPEIARSAEYHRVRQEMADSVSELVRAAHQAGELRPEITAADVVLLFKHLNPALPIAEPRRAELRARYLAVFVEGLRADRPAELPGPAPDWAEVHAMSRTGPA